MPPDDRGHWYRIWDGILEPAHVAAIGNARWVYDWCIAHTTEEIHGEDGFKRGKVLGWADIPAGQISDSLGLSVDKVRRDLSRLESRGYVSTEQKQRGLRITVEKSGRYGSGYAKMPTQDDPSGYAELPTQERKNAYPETQNCLPRNAKMHTLDSASPRKNKDLQPPMTEVKKAKTEEKKKTTSASAAATPDGDIEMVHRIYIQLIQPKARLTPSARSKVLTRLKAFTVNDLCLAIERFAADTWWMEHNGHRGLAWFCHTDDRIQGFVDMRPRPDQGNGTDQPKRGDWDPPDFDEINRQTKEAIANRKGKG